MNVEYLELDGIKYRRYPLSNSKKKRLYYHSSYNKSYHRKLWEKLYGKIPDGYHIHHKDGNPLNNNIENLECVSPQEHGKRHSTLALFDKQKDIYSKSRIWHGSLEGKEHHKNIWKIREKNKVNCKYCHKEIEKFKYSIGYTCNECKIKNSIEIQKTKPKKKKEKILIYKNCIICNEKIIQKTKRTKLFCSKGCKSKNRIKKCIDNVVRKCEICQNNFSINRYSKTVTCSYNCRNEKIRRKLIKAR